MDKEYIEREAVLRHKRKMSGTDFGGDFWDEAVLCEEIWKIPKADVAEVKHGEWIWKHVYGTEWSMLCCSVCNEIRNAIGSFKYCPNCGARMDGKIK